MTDDFELVTSPLSQEVTNGDKTVKIDIYGDGSGGWILEVVDEFNNSTVWDDPFPTDNAALAEAKSTILAEGIDSLIGPENEKGEWEQP